MARLLVVEHDADCPAGLLGEWASGRALAARTIGLHAGDTLPPAPDCDAAVLLGSEHTAYDDALPWLAAELAFVERLLAASVPVLGICFGGQLLARALGARLYRLPTPELGWARLASLHPGVPAGPWLSWHQDAFDLPPGAAELASNTVSLQAFAFGPHAGVQFHPEATAPIVSSWLASTEPRPGEEVTAPLFGDGAGPCWKQASAQAGELFSAWLDGRLARPAQ